MKQSPNLVYDYSVSSLGDPHGCNSGADQPLSARTLEHRLTELSRGQKKKSLKLEGNIYKGLAIGVKGNTYRAQVLVVMVMITQMTAPVLMQMWAHNAAYAMGAPVYIWEYGWNPLVIVTKILCTALLFVIYLQGDLHLWRFEQEMEEICRHFPNVDKKWLLADLLCNCGCVCGAAWSLPFLMWNSEATPMNIWLEVFGILFISNLDDYSGNIDFGTGEEEFNKAVEIAREYSNESMPLLAGVLDRSQDVSPLQVTSHILYNIMRLSNLVVGCLAVPAYFFAKFPAGKWHQTHGTVYQVFSHPLVLSISFGLFLLNHIAPMLRFVSPAHHAPRDALGFLKIVALRRNDERRIEPSVLAQQRLSMGIQ